MRIVIALAVVMLVLPGADLVSAQAPDDRIAAAMARAREAGVPVALLEAKIAEGRAKGVSMDRIAAAVERREGALESASQVIGVQEVGLTGLALAAEAVEGGVSQIALRTLIDAAPQDRRVVAIAVLAHLVGLGEAPPVALEAVRGAMSNPEALVNLLNLPAPAAGAVGGRGGPPSNIPIPGAGRGPTGAPAGPPTAIPAPGKSPQAGRPGGPPATPGVPPATGRPGGPPVTPGDPAPPTPPVPTPR